MPKRRPSRRLIILGIGILAYALVMTFGGCADRLILFPTRAPVDPEGATRRTIPFDGGTLEIWTARSEARQEPRAFVLEFTGNATRAEEIASYAASRWRHRRVELWAVNYPGYGGSSGAAKLKSIPPAALVAFDALESHAAGRPIIVAGNSLGSAVALYVAAHRPVAGVIAQNPPPLRDLILRKFGWWNLWLLAGPIALQVPGEMSAIQSARSVTAPGVFLIAEGDELVTPALQQKVVDAYAGPKRTIHLCGANHNSAVEGTALQELESAMDWLTAEKHLP